MPNTTAMLEKVLTIKGCFRYSTGAFKPVLGLISEGNYLLKS